MDSVKVAAFFDRLAPEWDETHRHDGGKIDKILDYADISEACAVLDVACGTGILIPYYLKRGVRSVTGIDLSAGMIARAKEKFTDPRVTLIVGDATETRPVPYDRCVIYSALPHFEDPVRLIGVLTHNMAPGGRITVAHSESRDAINRRHMDGAREVSAGLQPAAALASLLSPFLSVDTVVDNDGMYVVSGKSIKGGH